MLMLISPLRTLTFNQLPFNFKSKLAIVIDSLLMGMVMLAFVFSLLGTPEICKFLPFITYPRLTLEVMNMVFFTGFGISCIVNYVSYGKKEILYRSAILRFIINFFVLVKNLTKFIFLIFYLITAVYGTDFYFLYGFYPFLPLVIVTYILRADRYDTQSARPLPLIVGVIVMLLALWHLGNIGIQIYTKGWKSGDSYISRSFR